MLGSVRKFRHIRFSAETSVVSLITLSRLPSPVLPRLCRWLHATAGAGLLFGAAKAECLKGKYRDSRGRHYDHPAFSGSKPRPVRLCVCLFPAQSPSSPLPPMPFGGGGFFVS